MLTLIIKQIAYGKNESSCTRATNFEGISDR